MLENLCCNRTEHGRHEPTTYVWHGRPAGLYRGVGMTLLRDVPSHGVYFGVYDWTRDVLEPGCRASGHQSYTSALIAGAYVCKA